MIVVRDLHASRVNLRQNDLAAGLPSPLAFLGLAASIAPLIGVPRWSIGVLPIIHQIVVSPGRTRGQLVRDGKERFKSVEIPEDFRGQVRFSLIVEVEEDHMIDFGQALMQARLAGGTIFAEAPPERTIGAVAPDGSAFHGLRRGRAVLPMKGQPMARGRGDDIARYWDAVCPEPDPETEGPIPWRVPLAVGYHLLEDPATVPSRAGTREPGLPHVFAEPIAGVGELVSPRSSHLTRMSESQLRDVMWRYETDGADRVVAHHFYKT